MAAGIVREAYFIEVSCDTFGFLHITTYVGYFSYIYFITLLSNDADERSSCCEATDSFITGCFLSPLFVVPLTQQTRDSTK
jgi:hypothetical protein